MNVLLIDNKFAFLVQIKIVSCIAVEEHKNIGMQNVCNCPKHYTEVPKFTQISVQIYPNQKFRGCSCIYGSYGEGCGYLSILFIFHMFLNKFVDLLNLLSS